MNLTLTPSATLAQLAVVYARCSTDKQETSIAVQDAVMDKYMRGQDLVTVPELTLEEPAVSGRKAMWERREGKRALLALAEGVQDTTLSESSRMTLTAHGIHPDTAGRYRPRNIVFAALDRMARNAEHTLTLMKWAEKNGFVMHFVNIGGLTCRSDDWMGQIVVRLLLTILAGVAEMEAELTRGRIRQKMVFKRERGELCGHPAFGQRAVPTGRHRTRRIRNASGAWDEVEVPVMGWEEEPGEMAVLRRILALEAEGHGAWAIATQLNREGLTAKHGGAWTCRKVQSVLDNHFTASVRQENHSQLA